jgi:4-oxalocrotonate tautomerase
MPLVNISLRKGTTAAHRRAIADGIHQAMIDAMEIPADDRFQLVHEHAPENIIQDRMFFGIERSDQSVFIQIVVNHRDVSQKMKVYELIVENLAKDPGVRKEDIFIGIVEVGRENWWAFARYVNADGNDGRAVAKSS